MRTQQQAIADAIARRIIRNQTRKHFSAIHDEVLREIFMSVEHNIQHPKSDQQIADEKHAEHAALLARVAELEQRVAALESK